VVREENISSSKRTDLPILVAISQYLQRCLDTDANEAERSYRVALDDLIRCVPDLKFADQVTDEVMVLYGKALRQQGNGARTVFNKTRAVMGFLGWCGIDVKALRITMPRFEKKLPVVYSQEQIDALMKAATDPYFQVVLSVLHMTGLREQEAVHLGWHHCDFKRKLILVRSSLEHGFKIKDREERDVPMPDKLAVILKEWKSQRGTRQLVLGTSGDRPNQKWLRLLKRTARRAGLNCGRCDGCRKLKENKRECGEYTLHSFRRSYATALAWSGVDVRTISALLGHADIETTLLYLAPMRAEKANQRVNAAFS
jgi:integrase